VYHNSEENKTILGICGTKTDLTKDSVDDLKTDSSILIGNLTATRRYTDATDKLAGVKEKYGKSKIDITGHSLGGRVAEEMSGRVDGINEVHSYNPGSFVKDALTDLDCKFSQSKVCRFI
jgi:putative lipase involved disintegration of autophagic bodies